MSHIPELLIPHTRMLIEYYMEIIWEWVAEEAKAVFLGCENRSVDHHAVGAAGERGIAQLHPVHRHRFESKGWSWDDAFDPVYNLVVAKSIYDEQGWEPWTCK